VVFVKVASFKGFLVLFFLFPFFSLSASISSDCTWNGIKLYGKVKVVQSFADIEVKVVSSFPDLKVKKVRSFADRCGLWTFVESFPDFTVKFVNSFPDLKIKYVDSFPGL
jgi:hypothetical protein